MYGDTTMDYQDYLRVPQLLNNQVPQSRPAHHDELLFIIIHQAFELWFKLIVHELETTIGYMRNRNLTRAHHFLSRIVDVMRLFLDQIHLLETMQPVEFLQFRDRLKPASGFQSIQFREIEYLAGLKDPGYLRFFKHRPNLQKRLERRLKDPDLGSAYVEMLRGFGLRVTRPVALHQVPRDPEQWPLLWKVLLPLYQRPDTNYPLYLLTEKMLEFDETFSLWRNHHVHVVERIIGGKTGTGGSSGVAYLKTTTAKRCFPFLWDLRTILEAPERGTGA